MDIEEYNNKILETYNLYKELGSTTKVAQKLGIDPSTVRRRVANFYRNPAFSEVAKEVDQAGGNVDNIRHYWMKTKNPEGNEFSVFISNPNELDYDMLRIELLEELKEHSPNYERFEYDPSNEHLLIVDPADVHIGKLAVSEETGDNAYNIDEAIRRVKEGVSVAVQKASGFGIKQIALVVGNDILHIDNPKRGTTAGTAQDTDGMWWQMFRAARKLYVEIIEQLTLVAPVTIVYCPSNHDYQSGFQLVDAIYSWFHNNPNVSFGQNQELISINHRKYIMYGTNLIGFAHGDGAKEKDLPNLMQYEARTAWGLTKHAYWYLHHYHHKIRNVNGFQTSKAEKDHIGVTSINSTGHVEPENNTWIEYVRTPSPADPWHSRNGYVNKQALEVFLHHPTDGQVARFSHFF